MYSELVHNYLKRVPGWKRLGVWATLPLFFAFGASLELLMIKWTVGEKKGGVNFYAVYKRSRAKEIVAAELSQQRLYEEIARLAAKAEAEKDKAKAKASQEKS